MIALTLLAAPAFAGDAHTAFAVEALPRSDGESQWRGVVDVGGTETTGPWSFALQAGLRSADLGVDAYAPELYRLNLAWAQEDMAVAAGRVVRLDSRGIERLDGATMDLGGHGTLRGGVWAGRLWSPEEIEVPADTWVVGGEARFVPDGPAHATAAVGTESRFLDGAVRQRAHAALGVSTLSGHVATANGEVAFPTADEDLATRAGVRGELALARGFSASVGARWEGLPPAAVAEGAVSPMAWIAPDGYAAYSAGVAWRKAGTQMSVEGGGMVRPESTTAGANGALGRVGVAFAGKPVELYARGALLGDADLVGGGVAWTGEMRDVALRADGGLYRLTGLDSESGLVGEARLDADLPVFANAATDGTRERFHVRGSAATGTDRLLSVYWRAGLALVGEFDR